MSIPDFAAANFILGVVNERSVSSEGYFDHSGEPEL
jgi:hypothetical protein